jgi:hypothetical protein
MSWLQVKNALISSMEYFNKLQLLKIHCAASQQSIRSRNQNTIIPPSGYCLLPWRHKNHLCCLWGDDSIDVDTVMWSLTLDVYSKSVFCDSVPWFSRKLNTKCTTTTVDFKLIFISMTFSKTLWLFTGRSTREGDEAAAAVTSIGSPQGRKYVVRYGTERPRRG